MEFLKQPSTALLVGYCQLDKKATWILIFSPVIIDKSFAALDLAIGYLPENYVNLAQKFWVVETFSN